MGILKLTGVRGTAPPGSIQNAVSGTLIKAMVDSKLLAKAVDAFLYLYLFHHRAAKKKKKKMPVHFACTTAGTQGKLAIYLSKPKNRKAHTYFLTSSSLTSSLLLMDAQLNVVRIITAKYLGFS